MELFKWPVAVARDLVKYPLEGFIGGVYKFSAAARMGKSTLIVYNLVSKALNPYFYPFFSYEPDEVYSNLWIDVPGIHCGSNEWLLGILEKAIKEGWTHKVFIIE